MDRTIELIIFAIGIVFILFILFHRVTYICPKCGQKMKTKRKNGVLYLECPGCGHKSIDM